MLLPCTEKLALPTRVVLRAPPWSALPPRQCPLLVASGRGHWMRRMLRQAVHDHSATANAQKSQVTAKSQLAGKAALPAQSRTQDAPTLAQQLFPSSSPSNAHIPPTASVRLGALATNPSIANRQPRDIHERLVNPLKRSTSEIVRPTAPPLHVPAKAFSQKLAAKPSSLMSQLHRGVCFDENDFNDFPDDADIDLDDYTPPAKPTSTGALTFAPTLAQQRHAEPAPTHLPSSTSIPWSSSPPGHFGAVSRRDEQATILDETRLPEHAVHIESPELPPAKRRRLPWLEKAAVEPSEDAANNAASGKRSPARSRKTGRKASLNAEKLETTTPAPSKSNPPWNKTASAIKAEQKQHRQQANQAKRLVKDAEMSPSSKRKAKSGSKQLPRVFLSEEQQKVLNLVAQDKKSVFFTGSAGTGKSVLMREIIKSLRDFYKKDPDRVAVTASTGLAACNIGGVTLHSFGGIGLGKEPAEQLVKKIKKNPKARNRWARTKILVIDEISMVDGDLFDKLEQVARKMRNNGRPFGGIQLVVTGDFFQLPPVPEGGRAARFAFEAATWNTAIHHTIGLTKVFRQKDAAFANMLNEMRVGKLSDKSIAAFLKMGRSLDLGEDSETVSQATELFPTRQEVDSANNTRLRSLMGSGQVYNAIDGGAITDITQRDRLLANCMAPVNITLKKGAQVMLIKNIDETLVNGSVGTVVNFMDEKTFDIFHEAGDPMQSSGAPVPKSFARDPLDPMDPSFENSIRLSKLINADGPGITSLKWPVVRFKIADGTTRDLLCQRETWKIELPNGEVQAYRSQIPLILAWALSIHKAQGQTLRYVKVDLGRIFEKGQAYVALSRATTQDGLQVLRFDPKKVMAHDKVRRFYDSLYSVNDARGASSRHVMDDEFDYGHEESLMAAEQAYGGF